MERLQKVLARAGIASRRASEELIKAGRVRVNGRVVTELGTKVDPHKDRVEVDGKRLVAEKPVYYVVHKPREMVTTLDDPEGRATIADLLGPIPERVVPVGRLDYHTSGVLLVTNDGDMVDALLRPRSGVPKTYAAKFQGHLDVEELDGLRNGVTLDDGYRTKKAEVFVLREERNHTWVQMTLTEGKNRQIHRMGEAIGHRVMRLARQSFAGISIEGLRPGDYRELKRDELQQLKKKYLNPSRQTRGAARGA
ncbi:MAG: pseudouridine synthase [Polyangiales bacterium]